MKKNKSAINSEDEENLRKNPVNNFSCCDKVFTFNEFKEHLASDHKLTPDQFNGKKQMMMHMDGDYWFSYNYQWELETGLKFSQYVMMARSKDDTMRYG